MSDPLGVLIVPSLFNGPPGSANGGYFAGALARAGDLPEAAEITLRKPPPLERSMLLSAAPEGVVQLHHEQVLIAEGTSASLHGAGAPPAVPFATAKAAQERFPGWTSHPFPGCFVCGPSRGGRPGMRLFPGRIDAADGLFACTWTPAGFLADTGGRVRSEFVWAALDCPGAWTIDLESRAVVLGRITGAVQEAPKVGEPCVVTSRLDGHDGRKFTAGTAVYGADGRLLGQAVSVWIELPPGPGSPGARPASN